MSIDLDKLEERALAQLKRGDPFLITLPATAIMKMAALIRRQEEELKAARQRILPTGWHRYTAAHNVLAGAMRRYPEIIPTRTTEEFADAERYRFVLDEDFDYERKKFSGLDEAAFKAGRRDAHDAGIATKYAGKEKP